MEVFIDNDNIVYVLQLYNGYSSAYINSGTVTGQLKTSAGDNVGSALTFAAKGVGVDVVLGNKTYTDGNWYALLEEDADISEGTRYVMHIDADAGGDLKGHWEVPVQALVRHS